MKIVEVSTGVVMVIDQEAKDKHYAKLNSDSTYNLVDKMASIGAPQKP